MNLLNSQTIIEEKIFPFMESEGFDRRHVVLDMNVSLDYRGYVGEIFDTVTKQILWIGIALNEETVLCLTDRKLEMLENIHGFGSISLAGR